MSTRTFLVLVTLLGLVLVATVSAGVWMWQSRQDTGTVAIGGPFQLTDQAGKPVTDASWPGQWKLVYFGYTWCPDFCPTTLNTVTEAMEKLGPKADKVRPIFITVDPARDTVPVLADYHNAFDPRIEMLTGSPEQIAAVAKAYRVYFKKADPTATENYMMDHSTLTYLMDPQGRYVTHFAHDATAEAMAKRIGQAIGG